MVVSAFLIAGPGTRTTEKIAAPRPGEYKGEEKPEEIRILNSSENRALRWAFLSMAIFTALILWGLIPTDGFLRDAATGNIFDSPFMSSIVALISLSAAVAGIAYGAAAGTFKNDSDVIQGMSKAMETLGS